MPKIIVNAYDERHPEHQQLMEFECDTGLDISLLPTFEVEIDVPEVVTARRELLAKNDDMLDRPKAPITATSELKQLITAAEEHGAVVTVEYDQEAKKEEGRDIVISVQVSGLRGVGSHPMSAGYATERLRETLAQISNVRNIIV